jgi:hypothetical protein
MNVVELGNTIDSMLKIADVLGKSSAILHSDGLKVCQELLRRYQEHGTAVVSFEGVDRWTTAFLNASIGKFLVNLPGAQPVAPETLQFYGVTKDSLLARRIDEIIALAQDQQAQQQHDEAVREIISG